MERKTSVWSLIAGAVGGAVMGVLLVLAYRKWGGRLNIQQGTRKAQDAGRQRIEIRQVAQVGMLSFQLLRELARLFQRQEPA